MKNKNIDSGKSFDWGRTSQDYAKFRDIYPCEFYEKIIGRGLCTEGQIVLDIGTGTGVLPRNMYRYGADWTGIDISPEQIAQAKALSGGMNIDYRATSAEDMDFAENSFDVVTACQCFWYFDHEKIAPIIHRVLKPGGRFVLLCMEWLPLEDEVAAASENLVLKYNPKWSGGGATMEPIDIPEPYGEYFDLEYHSEYKLNVHFTAEGWNGRMKSCRGIGASLSRADIERWEREHMELLAKIAPCEFDVLHYAAVAVIKSKKR